MSRKILMSILIMVLALAAVGGATMAWFTDAATITPNNFVVGTVDIRADEVFVAGGTLDNWNPGDVTNKEITVNVTGSKQVYLRARITETWRLVRDAAGNSINPVTTTYTRRNAPNVSWLLAGGNLWNHNNAWQMITIGDADWWFYRGPVNGILGPDYGGITPPDSVIFLSQVRLEGSTTGNEHQGATYTLAVEFEAIQASNQAVNDAWGHRFDVTTGSWVPATS